MCVAGGTVAALALGAGAAASPATAATAPSSATLAAWSQAVLDQLNHERHRHGMLGVHMNVYLQRSARAHDGYMARYNTMSHRLPGEPDLGPRIAAAGYRPWCLVAENVAWTTDISQSGAQYLQSMMYTERPPHDGHRQIILNRLLRDIGITIIYDSAHHKIWMTEDFGRHC